MKQMAGDVSSLRISAFHSPSPCRPQPLMDVEVKKYIRAQATVDGPNIPLKFDCARKLCRPQGPSNVVLIVS